MTKWKLNKAGIIILLKITFSLLFIIYLIFYVKPEAIIKALRESDKIYLFAAILIGAANLSFKFFKWHYICKNIIGESNKKKNWSSFIGGVTAGIFTPARAGEFIARGLPYENRTGMMIATLTAIDKFSNLFGILVYGGLSIAIAVISGALKFEALNFLLILIAAAGFAAGLFVMRKKSLGFLKSFAGKYKFIGKFIAEIEQLENIGKSFIAGIVIIAFLLVGLNIFQFALLFKAFDSGNSISLLLLISTMVFYTKSLLGSFAFTEVGIREGTSVYFSNLLGVSAAVGFNSAILLFFINILIPASIGLFFINKKKYD